MVYIYCIRDKMKTMKDHMSGNYDSRPDLVQDFIERLALESGLVIYPAAAAQGLPLAVQRDGILPGNYADGEVKDREISFNVQLGENKLELVCLCSPEETWGGPLTVRLLQVLAQKIWADLTGSYRKDGLQDMWTWNRLLKQALVEQWDQKTLAARASAYRLAGLSRGFPVLVHCSPWVPEAVDVLKNLFPEAPVFLELKPDLFIYVPVEREQSGISEQRARGDALISQIHSLLADESGITATIFVGEVIDIDLLAGLAAVRKLAELHGRFYTGRPGLAAWQVGLAGLMQEIQRTVVQEYIDMLLGRLNKELLNTLETFLQKDLNVADAARALFVHRNTLIYRLERIRELTGYDPRSFDESVNLFLALWLKKNL